MRQIFCFRFQLQGLPLTRGSAPDPRYRLALPRSPCPGLKPRPKHDTLASPLSLHYSCLRPSARPLYVETVREDSHAPGCGTRVMTGADVCGGSFRGGQVSGGGQMSYIRRTQTGSRSATGGNEGLVGHDITGTSVDSALRRTRKNAPRHVAVA